MCADYTCCTDYCSVCGLYSIKINVIAKYERNSGCTGAIQESYSISVFKTQKLRMSINVFNTIFKEVSVDNRILVYFKNEDNI